MNSLGITALSGGGGGRGPRGLPGKGIDDVVMTDNSDGSFAFKFKYTDATESLNFGATLVNDSLLELNRIKIRGENLVEKFTIKDDDENVIFNINTSTKVISCPQLTADRPLRLDGSGNLTTDETVYAPILDPVFTNNVTVNGRILGANGTASAPSYGFASTSGMGMYRATSNSIGFAVGNNSKFRIQESFNYSDVSLLPGTGNPNLGLSTNRWNNVHAENLYPYNSIIGTRTILTADKGWRMNGTSGLSAFYLRTSGLSSADRSGIVFGRDVDSNFLLTHYDSDYLNLYYNTNSEMTTTGIPDFPVADATTQRSIRFHKDGFIETRNGSASLPAYRFIDNISTGMYFLNTNTIGFSSNGTRRFRVGPSSVISDVDILPDVTDTINLGSNSFRWATIRSNNVNLNGTLTMGTNTITSDNYFNFNLSRIRFRQGGSAPGIRSGICFSNYDASHFFTLNDTGTFKLIFSSENNVNPIFPGDTSFSGTEVINLTNTGRFRLVEGSASLPSYSFINDTASGMFLSAVNDLRFSTNGTFRLRLTDANTIVNNNFIPSATNTLGLGSSSFRWSNIHSVLGNFSGVLTTNNVIPDGNATRDLGSSGTRWLNLFGRNINLDANIHTANGSASVPSHSFTSDVQSGMYLANTGELGFCTGGLARLRLINTGSFIHTHFLPNTTGLDLGTSSNRWRDLYTTNVSLGTSSNLTSLESGESSFALEANNKSGTKQTSGHGMSTLEVRGTSGGGSMRYSFTFDQNSALTQRYYQDFSEYRPVTNNTIFLGTSIRRWAEIWCTNALNTSSDARVKNTIEDSALGLDFINQLRPVSYKMNDGDSGRTHYGLIAQEVEQVLEDNDISTHDFAGLVHDVKPEHIDPATDEVTPASDFYGLRYSEFISPMIKAIQELTALVQQQQEKIETLESQMQGLIG